MDRFFDQILYDYALSWLRVPYIWGGSSFDGVDCSGLVVEILKSAGMVPYGYDSTAMGIATYFADPMLAKEVHEADFGDLVFFGGSNTNIKHVGFCLDAKRMIEAGGGDRNTKTKQDALYAGAFVRVRPINHRKDVVVIIRPDYQKGK